MEVLDGEKVPLPPDQIPVVTPVTEPESVTDGLLAHGRMILVDRRIAVIGSFHLSPPSLDWRREVALVIDDPPILTELYDYFENLVRDE